MITQFMVVSFFICNDENVNQKEMKTNSYFFIAVFILIGNVLYAAEAIKGKVVDRNRMGIEGVAVVLQTSDSTFVDAIVTDSMGMFTFKVEDGAYRLLFQHLLYETKQMDVSGSEIGTIELEEKDYELAEVVVKGERPHVKVNNGAIVYNTPQLIQNKPVSNAFEAIKELPGITGNDEKLELLGAGNLHIVLNGQVTTMSINQLIDLLKSIPASRVQRTEIMYNAPAKYNVKGALINVIIDQDIDQGQSLQGEAGVEYQQRHNALGVARTNLLYLSPQLSIDFLANGRAGKTYGGEDMFARHILKDEEVEIDQVNRGKGNPRNGSLRLGIDYTFKNSSRLSASYYLDADKTKSTRTSNSVFTYPDENKTIPAFSKTQIKGNSTLQNVLLQYTGNKGLTAGVDFTHYRNPEHQHFVNNSEDGSTTDMLNDSKQNISKWMGFINHTHTFNNELTMNYGINGSYTSSDTKVDYAYHNGNEYIPDNESRLDNEQVEYGGNAFMEVSKNFGSFSATVSLKGEYFKSDYTSNGRKSVLWDDFAIFPNASLSYTFSPYHVLQLNVSSDKTYPSYWSINPQTSYLNAYSVIQGNPSLKPSRSYEGQLLYIFRQKYIFMAFTEYEPDYFAQQPYQNDSILKNIFRFENFDFRLLTGIGAVVPVNIGSRIHTRLTIQGMRLQEKDDDYHQSSFNKSKYFGRIAVNNTINVSETKPNLKLTLSGYYLTSAIQGIYDLGSSYDVSAGLKWSFAREKGTLTLNYNNIFQSNMPKSVRINMANQYSRMKGLEYSSINVAFSWKFGGYKERKHEKMDDSRFGK